MIHLKLKWHNQIKKATLPWSTYVIPAEIGWPFAVMEFMKMGKHTHVSNILPSLYPTFCDFFPTLNMVVIFKATESGAIYSLQSKVKLNKDQRNFINQSHGNI